MSKSVTQSQRRQAHRTFTKQYWKKRADTIFYEQYMGQHNYNRMKLGNPPRRLALVEGKKSGLRVEKYVALELHHADGYCRGDIPQEDQELIEVWPWEHEEIDPNRHIGYKFIEWRGFL